MTDKENIEEILYKFTNTYDGKTEMLHQDNFSGVINDLQTLLKEREKEAVKKGAIGFAEWFDKRYLHPEGVDCSGVLKYYLRNLKSNNLGG